MKNRGQNARRLVLGATLLLVILLPFALFGEQMDRWVIGFVDSGARRPVVSALVIGGLLAGDILLPVPSSIASTACGMLFGVVGGTLVSWLGMVVSCVAGFWLARLFGRPFVRRFAGASDVARMEALNARFGAWAIVLARPIPVLAEASVLVVGLGALPFRRFMVLCSLSNLGISLLYAVAGAYAAGIRSFLPALAASVALPWVLMSLTNRRNKHGDPAPGAESEGDAT